MESNKRAMMILLALVMTAVLAFKAERRFLIRENRGSTISQYEAVNETDNIMLLIEDFEGLNCPDTCFKSDSVLKTNGFFTFGSAKIAIDRSRVDHDPMASKSDLLVEWQGTEKFGGWGKGVGANIELDPLTDYLNFRVYLPECNGKEERIKVLLGEDDNEDAIFEEDQDDIWGCKVTISAKDGWQLISIPLKDFTDENAGGDGIFNVTRRGGLHTITFVLDQPDKYVQGERWYFDFINISSVVPANGARFSIMKTL